MLDREADVRLGEHVVGNPEPQGRPGAPRISIGGMDDDDVGCRGDRVAHRRDARFEQARSRRGAPLVLGKQQRRGGDDDDVGVLIAPSRKAELSGSRTPIGKQILVFRRERAPVAQVMFGVPLDQSDRARSIRFAAPHQRRRQQRIEGDPESGLAAVGRCCVILVAVHRFDDAANLVAYMLVRTNLQRIALGNAEVFIAADMRFHQRIAAIPGNPIFEAVAESMLGWLKQYHTEMLIWTGKENLTLVEHEEIVAALRQRDPVAAEAAMVRHLERSRALYVHQGA